MYGGYKDDAQVRALLTSSAAVWSSNGEEVLLTITDKDLANGSAKAGFKKKGSSWTLQLY